MLDISGISIPRVLCKIFLYAKYFNIWFEIYVFVQNVHDYSFNFVFKSAVVLNQHVAHAGSFTVLPYLFDWNAYLLNRITPNCDAMYRC